MTNVRNKILGMLIIVISVVVLLIFLLTIIVSFFDKEMREWLNFATIFGYVILSTLFVFFLRYGRKIYIKEK